VENSRLRSLLTMGSEMDEEAEKEIRR